MSDEQFDVIIIGGGPAGNSAAIYTARAELKTLVLTKPGRSGALSVTEHIANYPGVPGPIPGAEVIGMMRRQAESFGATYREEVVIAVQLEGDIKEVYTNEGGAYQGRAIIIASGALERKTKIPGEEEFLGRGVSTCIDCDAAFFQGKKTLVAGNDDYAAEEALALARYAAQVIFLTPTAKPQVAPQLLAELEQHPAIEIHTGWRLREIFGDTHFSGAHFQTSAGEETLEADGIFLYLGGAQPSTSFLYGQLPLGEDGGIITNADHSTNIPRVYAIGDVASHHVKQAVISAGEGCMAALAIERDLRGRAKLTVDYK